ncbi:hypothetical protein VTO42DRAFT_6268 [Malbranchea cinnamomea]
MAPHTESDKPCQLTLPADDPRSTEQLLQQIHTAAKNLLGLTTKLTENRVKQGQQERLGKRKQRDYVVHPHTTAQRAQRIESRHCPFSADDPLPSVELSDHESQPAFSDILPLEHELRRTREKILDAWQKIQEQQKKYQEIQEKIANFRAARKREVCGYGRGSDSNDSDTKPAIKEEVDDAGHSAVTQGQVDLATERAADDAFDTTKIQRQKDCSNKLSLRPSEAQWKEYAELCYRKIAPVQGSLLVCLRSYHRNGKKDERTFSALYNVTVDQADALVKNGCRNSIRILNSVATSRGYGRNPPSLQSAVDKFVSCSDFETKDPKDNTSSPALKAAYGELRAELRTLQDEPSSSDAGSPECDWDWLEFRLEEELESLEPRSLQLIH